MKVWVHSDFNHGLKKGILIIWLGPIGTCLEPHIIVIPKEQGEYEHGRVEVE